MKKHVNFLVSHLIQVITLLHTLMISWPELRNGSIYWKLLEDNPGVHPLKLFCTLIGLISGLFLNIAVYFLLTQTIQSIETQAIKIAFILAPWATNSSCYNLVTFPKILTRLRTLSKNFLNINLNDELIEPLIKDNKISIIGQHSSIYKLLNF